ncbi:right-handed parallel beta-helix repeat-containing protein [Methanobacterium paludis]|uniref:Parallel beta-helix repeat protein n=1 Tax=Methanobacterium paludis (strain DSM 25820 / JCM 18151 / SWAN1) TaxID=868131 RepID=F6D351_METPW|nr:NosD domain-containing protein [Methanobacterium paludis]AEG17991.1 parallel beta-helix repeat protein [Methanobacterium paludis]
MRKNMQKRTAMLALTFVFALVICGAVAAADNTTATASSGSSVSAAPATTTTASTPATTTATSTTTTASTPATTTATSTPATTTTASTPATTTATSTPATTTTASTPAASTTPTSTTPATGETTTAATAATTSGGDPYIVGSPIHYSTIQQAVDAAICGDTIIVGCGVYKENVVINKMLTLIGLDGAVVVACDPNKPVFQVNACGSGTTIKGFTIMGGSDGVELNHADNVKIRDNKIVANGDGIELNHADWNLIKDNEIKYNLNDGISLSCSDGNVIECNEIKLNKNGVSLSRSEGNWIKGNEIEKNLDSGVKLCNSNWNKIINNEIENNYCNGIHLLESDGNLIKCNDITNNRGKGVFIDGSRGNVIINNNIKTCVPCSVCVYVKDSEGTGPADRTSEFNEIHFNNIIASGPFSLAIVNNGCKKLNAQCNWFGCGCPKIGGCGITLICPVLKCPVKCCGTHRERFCCEKFRCERFCCGRHHERFCCGMRHHKEINKKEKETMEVGAAKVTTVTTSGATISVPMQTTGAPLALLALALLAVFGGLIPKRK